MVLWEALPQKKEMQVNVCPYWPIQLKQMIVLMLGYSKYSTHRFLNSMIYWK